MSPPASRPIWRVVVLAVVLTLGPAGAAVAAPGECDCTEADCKGLEPLDKKLNELVKKILEKKPADPVQAVYDTLGKNVSPTRPITPIEDWLVKNPTTPYMKVKKQADSSRPSSSTCPR